MPPACQSLGTPSCLHCRHTREVKHVIFPKHGDLSTMKSWLLSKRMQNAELSGSGPGAGPGKRGPRFGPQLGSGSVYARVPLTEGFDATAKQLLHRAALVQVYGARHGRRRG